MKIRSVARVLALLIAAVVVAEAAQRLFSPDLVDPETRVWLGGMVTLGMPEASARAVLDQRYELVKRAAETYYLRVKDSSPPKTEGAVSFHQGKLTFVSQEFYRSESGGGDATAFADAAYAAVALARSYGQPCAVSTRERQAAGAKIEETYISCGHRTARIAMSRAPGSSAGQLKVSEELR